MLIDKPKNKQSKIITPARHKDLEQKVNDSHKQFEDISATDFRVVYYIPQDAINSYPGTLTQNPTQ